MTTAKAAVILSWHRGPSQLTLRSVANTQLTSEPDGKGTHRHSLSHIAPPNPRGYPTPEKHHFTSPAGPLTVAGEARTTEARGPGCSGRARATRLAGGSMQGRLKAAAGAVLAGLIGAGTAQAQEVTLTVHHFLSPKSATHTELIQPWAERLRAQSDGRIDVKVFPSMSLGGSPPELYRQARDGTADVVVACPAIGRRIASGSLRGAHVGAYTVPPVKPTLASRG